MDVIGTIGEALSSTEFLIGLRNGTVALTLGVLSALVWRRSPPVAALYWAGAAGAGLYSLWGLSTALVVGLGLLVLAGLVSPSLDSLPWLRVIAAAPGGWLLARHLDGPEWIHWFVLAVIVLGGPLVATTEPRLERNGIGILMWAFCLAGVYGTVPDTEQALVLLGAGAPLAVLGLVGLTRFGALGSYAAVGLLGWATAIGGIERPASIVGGLACLGVFLIAPLSRRGTLQSSAVLLATHVVIVAIASRVAGLRTSVFEAAVIATSALLLGLVVLTLAGLVRGERVTDPDSRAVSS